MMEPLRLLCVLAHPDDESLGVGGTLAKYAAEGVETYLITATRGERGWWGDEQGYPGPEALGRIREQELLAAAHVLRLREVRFLGYIDGKLDQANPTEAIARIVGHLRRLKPHVVITFDPFGGYGHPDHIAISQFTTAAVVAAADPDYIYTDEFAPHRVAKLYYMASTHDAHTVYQSIFGDLVMHVDGAERRAVGWPEWAITTRINTEAHWRRAWQAITCHKSQLPDYAALENLPEEQHKVLWGCQTYYRAYSTVNGGRQIEDDLFAGLR
jgi:LmbE family N-acetylglucosaminyl deacetylase